MNLLEKISMTNEMVAQTEKEVKNLILHYSSFENELKISVIIPQRNAKELPTFRVLSGDSVTLENIPIKEDLEEAKAILRRNFPGVEILTPEKEDKIISRENPNQNKELPAKPMVL